MSGSRLIGLMMVVCVIAGAASTACAQDEDRDEDDRRRRMERQEKRASLKVGQMAPRFRLASPDGASTFDLGSFRDQRPVILFFGSYT